MTAPISTYTPTSWVDGALGNTPIDADNLNKIEQGVVNSFALTNSLRVTPTAIKTGTYNPVAGDFAIYSASANITNTLPKATVGARIKLKKIDATAFTVLFNVATGDTIDSSATSLTLRLQNETRTLMGAAGGWWIVDGLNPLSGLDARYLLQTAADARYTQQGPYYLGYKSATQSIPNAFATEPYTPVTFENEDYDTHNGHSNTTNPSRYTIPTGWPGLYQVNSTIVFNAGGSASNRRIASVARNGVRTRMGQSTVTSAGSDVAVQVSSFVTCVEGDYLETTCYQESGAAMTLYAGTSATTSMFVRYVRPT